jgi:hypothetical protein
MKTNILTPTGEKNIDSKYSPRLRSKPNGLTLQKIDNHQSIRALEH